MSNSDQDYNSNLCYSTIQIIWQRSPTCIYSNHVRSPNVLSSKHAPPLDCMVREVQNCYLKHLIWTFSIYFYLNVSHISGLDRNPFHHNVLFLHELLEWFALFSYERKAIPAIFVKPITVSIIKNVFQKGCRAVPDVWYPRDTISLSHLAWVS